MPALHRRRGLWSRHQGDWSGSLYFKHQGIEPLLCLTSSYAKQWAGRFLSHSPIQNRVMRVGVWAKEPKGCPNSTTEEECSVAKLCSTLCDPMDCSTPGSSVLHYLSKFAQIHVHWGSDAILRSPHILREKLLRHHPWIMSYCFFFFFFFNFILFLNFT